MAERRNKLSSQDAVTTRLENQPPANVVRDMFGGGGAKPPQGGIAVKPLLPYGVGIDTHSKFIQVCVLVQYQGEVLQFEQEFTTKWPDLVAAKVWAADLVIRHGQPLEDQGVRYTIESTGTYHRPVLLAWRGIASVVNPVLAGPTRRKSDVLDARMLAHHSLTGMWPVSFIPPCQAENLRVLLGMRYEQARTATRCLNRVNNHILRYGHTFGREYSMADPYARAAIDEMCNGIVPPGDSICPDGIPEPVRPFFVESYKLYDASKKLRDQYQRMAIRYVHTHEWAVGAGTIKGNRLMECLMSVPGVGEVTALTWLAIIVDPRRFNNVKQVAAFCGADPSLKVSAGKVTQHIKRKGNARLHHVLKNVSAQLVRRASEPIGTWGYNIYRRHAKGGWAKAVNAVSRRLAIFMWRVHFLGEEFSYEQYRFYLTPEVNDVPLAAMELGTRYETLLRESGCSTSKDVAAMFMTSLPQQKGVGAGCLKKVKEWIDSNRVASPNQSQLPAQASKPSPPRETVAEKLQSYLNPVSLPVSSSTAKSSGGRKKKSPKKTRGK